MSDETGGLIANNDTQEARIAAVESALATANDKIAALELALENVDAPAFGSDQSARDVIDKIHAALWGVPAGEFQSLHD